MHTLLQDPSQKQPSINAFLGARYSRSADSVVDIAKEIMAKGTDASKRLETIFQNYGHKSVGDMADLFVCLENVPMITAMRVFYLNSVLAGQERSTRFQNFENPEYVKLPASLKLPKDLVAEYDAIIHEHMANYRELLKPTKQFLQTQFKVDPEDKKQASALQARTFDTARYFLPLGLQTSLGLVMSARNWADFISQLGASTSLIDQELTALLLDLLTGKSSTNKKYLPEADSLLRHTEPNMDRATSTAKALSLLKKHKALRHFPELPGSNPRQRMVVKTKHDAIYDMLQHFQLLAHPTSRAHSARMTDTIWEEFSKIIFKYHHQNSTIGQLAQAGSIAIEGWADFGVLKDLNRHRSMERFVPVWHDEVNLTEELDRPPAQCFFLCDYLSINGANQLRKEYETRLKATYKRIQAWHKKSKKHLSEGQRTEFTRYLLPHAHATKYRFYGSIDDIQYVVHLRTRNGGHIAYRGVTMEWLHQLARADRFWQGLLNKLPDVQPGDRKQFLDRS